MLFTLFLCVVYMLTISPHIRKVTVANVGDSQAFLMRNGQAVALTTPHKVYGSGALSAPRTISDRGMLQGPYSSSWKIPYLQERPSLPLCLLLPLSGPEVRSETARVKATGAWIHDGRVCNILAVSRAFGDWEFKGEGVQQLLSAGVTRE